MRDDEGKGTAAKEAERMKVRKKGKDALGILRRRRRNKVRRRQDRERKK